MKYLLTATIEIDGADLNVLAETIEKTTKEITGVISCEVDDIVPED